MTKPTCPVCDGEMIWDISADAARYICLWSEKQPEMHAQLADAVAERDALRKALAALVAACHDQRSMCGPEWVDALTAAEAALADGDAAE